jgi:Acetyltransferase (GNAT) domain
VIRLERVALARVPWPELDAFADRTVFQTRGWLSYIEASQRAEPVIARVLRGGTQIGWYTGAIVRKLGFKFLGSPLRGWTTSYMGFNLHDGENPVDVLPALRTFAFEDLGCIHCEVMDQRFVSGDGAAHGYLASPLDGFQIDLLRPAEKILAGMNQARRHAIRRAPRNGVTVEEAHGLDFADEHYAQLCDVFAKQGLPPPYPAARIRMLIEHVAPTGKLLLVRARDANGRSIATGMFPGHGRLAHFWMGASWRDGQKLLPNEAIQWFVINHWRDRGAALYDMGGGGDYKSKYGGKPIQVGWLRVSRFAAMDRVRSELLKLRKRVRAWQGKRAGLG